ncbi:uncharacterized protein VTP21DRAFT_9352 [Calcarisporiella thermophila]|uniref:uncharacterized protein n=1 Tax=Calcarisporiella thermophila TaxID=911321 RepID=UPI0037424FCA
MAIEHLSRRRASLQWASAAVMLLLAALAVVFRKRLEIMLGHPCEAAIIATSLIGFYGVAKGNRMLVQTYFVLMVSITFFQFLQALFLFGAEYFLTSKTAYNSICRFWDDPIYDEDDGEGTSISLLPKPFVFYFTSNRTRMIECQEELVGESYRRLLVLVMLWLRLLQLSGIIGLLFLFRRLALDESSEGEQSNVAGVKVIEKEATCEKQAEASV